MSGKMQVFLILLVIGIVYGCAGSTNPTIPGLEGTGAGYTQAVTNNGRLVLGIWEVQVTETGIITVPVDRYLAGDQVHYNVKVFLKPPFCDDCLSFSNLSDDSTNQILSADVTIKNPTVVEGADVRGIVLSNNPDVYLVNPDDYTTFYDVDDPPDINPFRLFGKDLENGIVGPDVEVTEHFELHYDQVPFLFKTAVDAINPVDALREPYSIQNQTIDGALDDTGVVTRMISVDVYDRNDDVGLVSVVNEDLGIEIVLIPDSSQENHFYGSIMNESLAGVGEYELMIKAADSVQEWILYDYMTMTISDDLGFWEPMTVPLPNGDCATDLSGGYDLASGMPSVFFAGGSGCDGIWIADDKFVGSNEYFSLNDIDPLNPGFNPYPVKRIEASLAGGLGFFSDTDVVFDDGFYNGPISALLVTLFPGIGGQPTYFNFGDGDSSRMYPSDNSLVGVDIADDTEGNLYGIWADPDGILAPEMYGLTVDYTRHDVIMGGILPSDLVGEGPGKVSPQYDNIKAISIGDVSFEMAIVYVLENNGTSSEIEVLMATIDAGTFTTTFSSGATIDLGAVDAVDMTGLMQRADYLPNPEYATVAVLVQGTGGGYLSMYNSLDFSLVEDVGSESDPIVPGVMQAIDANNARWTLLVLNESHEVTTLSFNVG